MPFHTKTSRLHDKEKKTKTRKKRKPRKRTKTRTKTKTKTRTTTTKKKVLQSTMKNLQSISPRSTRSDWH